MVKKNKRRRLPKKRSKIGYFILIAIFLGCIITIGFLINHYISLSKTSPPLYEEIYVKSSDLTDKIKQTDHLIYETLFQAGIGEENVYFTSVRSQHEKGHEWEYTELLINLSDKDQIPESEKIFDEKFSTLGSEIKIGKENLSEHDVVYNVYISGLHTHRIRLFQNSVNVEKPHDLPRIAFIIDDLGYDRKMARDLMKYELPLSFSVLPFAPFVESIVNEANEKGCELLLHLPMEPENYPKIDPGPGALLTNMTDEEIRKRTNDMIAKIPGLKGVNHHMGSKFTEKSDKMKIVLGVLKKRNLFYVDSRTTPKTIAYKLAKEMGVPAAKKSLFLDHELSDKAIKYQMERLLGIARYSGMAVGIGHPHEKTLRIMNEYLEQLKTDYEIVPVSKLVD